MRQNETDLKERIKAYLTPLLLSVLGFLGTSRVNGIEKELKRLNDKTEIIIRNNTEIENIQKNVESLWKAVDKLRDKK
jgi:hypothetical protein